MQVACRVVWTHFEALEVLPRALQVSHAANIVTRLTSSCAAAAAL